MSYFITMSQNELNRLETVRKIRKQQILQMIQMRILTGKRIRQVLQCSCSWNQQ